MDIAGQSQAEHSDEGVRPMWLHLGIAALSGVLLSGCLSGDTSAPPATTTSVAPSTPPTATTTSVDTDDHALAMAAVERYYEHLNAALRSRRTADFRTTFTPACSVCKGDAQRIDDAAARGHTFEGEGFTVSELKTSAQQDGHTIIVRGTVALPPLTTRDARGNVIQRSSGSVGQKDFSVVRYSGLWVVDLVSR